MKVNMSWGAIKKALFGGGDVPADDATIVNVDTKDLQNLTETGGAPPPATMSAEDRAKFAQMEAETAKLRE